MLRAIDMFAGWGGFTLGASLAGLNVVWAANHWPVAVEAHAANHPHVAHVCQDLRQADWTTLPSFDVLLASPACQPHSQASQPKRRPKHDAERATAWAVIDCADACEPRAIVVENVLDFRRWRLFEHWRGALAGLGYHVELLELVATDFGVAQRRTRLFVVATREPVLMQWPRAAVEPVIGDLLDWPSGEWRPVSEASSGARARIEAGRRLGRRFWVQHVSHHTGAPLTRAISTITCQDQHAIVDGDRYRPLTIRETARAMGFPDSYGWPPGVCRRDAIRGLGNAVCPPVARALLERLVEQLERASGGV
jgi:DNA (cytosine-5)-methyltransferase 1